MARSTSSPPPTGRRGRAGRRCSTQLGALEPADLVQAQREVARLLEDDNVTYTPSPASTVSIADRPDTAQLPLSEPQPWRLDPLPLILDDREWSSLEAGVVQRAELLDAIMADLYGAAAAAGPAGHPAGRGAGPRRVPAHRGRHRGAGRPAAGHDRRRPRPGRDRPVEGDLRPHPGPVRRRVRDAEPPGGVPGAARGLPLGQPLPADPLLLGHAAGPGRRGAEHGGGPAGRGAQPGHRTPRPPSTRPSSPPCSASRCWRAAT